MPKNRWQNFLYQFFFLVFAVLIMSGCSLDGNQEEKVNKFIENISYLDTGWTETRRDTNVGLLPRTTKVVLVHQSENGDIKSGMEHLEKKLAETGETVANIKNCGSINIKPEDCQINTTSEEYLILVKTDGKNKNNVITEIVSR